LFIGFGLNHVDVGTIDCFKKNGSAFSCF